MNNQLSHVAWQKILKKSIVWIIYLFIIAILQTTLAARYRLFDAVPDLVLPAIISVALLDGERTGTISGIAGGIIIDALGGSWLSLSPLVYMLCSVAVAILTHYFLRRDFISWFFSCAFALAFSTGISVINLYSSVNTDFIKGSLIFEKILVPQFFSSLILGIPVFFITKLIWKLLFNNREMES